MDTRTAMERRARAVLHGPRSRRGVLKSITVAAGAVVFAGVGRAPRVAAQDTVRLVQWYHQYGEAGTQEAALRYAEEYTSVNPNVEVEMVWVPGDYEAKLASALLTDEGPDVFEGRPTRAMVKADQIVPLDDILTEETRADFHPNNIAANSIDGKLYAIKMIDDMGLLYYRPSMLDEKGVTPPQTMDEVIAAAKALDTGRTKGLFLGNDGGVSAMITIAPWSAGADFLVDNEIVFDNERTVASYQKVKELKDSGALLIGAPTDWWDPSAFTQNLTAMQWTGLWAMPGITAGVGEDFGVLPWPALDGEGTPATFWGGWAQMVNARSAHTEEAKAFVQWLWVENTANQQDWSLAYGFHVPPRLSAAEAAEPLKSGPAAEAVGFLAEYGRILPPDWTQAMTTAITDALSNIVNNNADAAAAVAAAAEKCTAELAQVLG